MNDTPSKPLPPNLDMLLIQEAYSYSAEMAVEAFNRVGVFQPCLFGLNFMADGSFQCTVIDPEYVHKALASPTGVAEIRRFIDGLLDESAMPADMKAQGFTPADIVVFITEIMKKPEDSLTEPSFEWLLVTMHTRTAVYRGFNPILAKPKRHAMLVPMTMDAPEHARLMGAERATLHDLHAAPEKIQ